MFSRFISTQRSRPSRWFIMAGGVVGVTAIAVYGNRRRRDNGMSRDALVEPDAWRPPSRDTMLSILRQNNTENTTKESKKEYDVLVVGGGATGCGVALDAVTRGLSVALVERDDFSSGTSSRSTKLVHGGVRYLEKAFRELDWEQYKLVKEALHERKVFLDIAPYLSYPLPIMIPIYKWWLIPYYWAGSKMYDMLAGGESLEKSYYLTRSRALEMFPMLRQQNLAGAMVYYDGQHNDSRMNVALAMTAIRHGALVANHTEVVRLLFEEDEQLEGEEVKKGKVCGAVVKDRLSGDEFPIYAKVVVNATGPFTDGLLALEDPTHKPVVVPSGGTHIILPNYYSPSHMGLIDPSTRDGRVLFLLPWQGSTIAGTTDAPCDVTENPLASEAEIRWLLDEVRKYLGAEVKVRREDVMAAWSGIRPLLRDEDAASTQALVRNHVVKLGKRGMVTIAGGKWTTYRAMAQDCVDAILEQFPHLSSEKQVHPCMTESVKLYGSHAYSPTLFIRVAQRIGVQTDVARHLADSYGDRAFAVGDLVAELGQRWPMAGKRLAAGYPYLEAEVRWACRYEMACTVVDVIARRTRLAFLNAGAAYEALPRVVELMSEELGWDAARQKMELENARAFLNTMGLLPGRKLYDELYEAAYDGWIRRDELGVKEPLGAGSV